MVPIVLGASGPATLSAEFTIELVEYDGASRGALVSAISAGPNTSVASRTNTAGIDISSAPRAAKFCQKPFLTALASISQGVRGEMWRGGRPLGPCLPRRDSSRRVPFAGTTYCH